jgi:hypothetical protein
MQVNTAERQSLMDLAVQGYGDLLQVFTIIADNPGLYTLRDNGGAFLTDDFGVVDLGYPVRGGVIYSVQDGSDLQNQRVLQGLPGGPLATCDDFYRSPDVSIGDFNSDFNNDFNISQ